LNYRRHQNLVNGYLYCNGTYNCNGTYIECLIADLAAAELDRVHERIASRFARAEPRAWAREYVRAWRAWYADPEDIWCLVSPADNTPRGRMLAALTHGPGARVGGYLPWAVTRHIVSASAPGDVQARTGRLWWRGTAARQ
jgi:hypothetical protein